MRKIQNRFKQKLLERHTGVSPETNLSIAWNVLSVTSPFFIHLTRFNYDNTEWSKCMPDM
jgi:hypothetical protein